MLLRSVFAAASLSAVANAFLVVPQVSTDEIEAFEAVPVEAIALAQTQTVRLECAGCPPVFKKDHDRHEKPKNHKKPHKHHHSSHLELDFTVVDANRLTVNGFELYPNSDPFSDVLIASQVADFKPKHHGGKHRNKHEEKEEKDDTKALKSHHKYRPHEHRPKSVEQQLGFGLQIHPVQQTADEGLDLIEVDLQIIEVGSVFVDGLPNVRVHLIRNPSGDLLIAKVEQTASENLPSSPQDNANECTTVLCKWRAILAQQLERMKLHGCAHMMGGANHGHGANTHHHHGHHPGHMAYRQHRWALLFRKLTSHIILPVLIGIVTGVSVSVIGMVVGTILVGLWRKFVRGQSFFPSHHCRRLRLAHHKASRHEAAVAEEKAGLVANQEDDLPPPPKYEDGEAEHVERI